MGFGKDGMGVILKQTLSEVLLTLDTDTVLLITAKPATLERYRMLRTEVYALIESITTNEGNGLSLWLADGDLSLAEVEAAIEANGPLGPNDTVAEAVAERFVVFMGAIDQGNDVDRAMKDAHTNAPLCVAKPRWTFARTKSWNFVIYNVGAQLTTGATINLRVKNFGVWVT